FFGTRELDFGAENSGLSLSRADADRALAGGDARLLATVASMAEAERIAAKQSRRFEHAVEIEIERLLPGATIDAVARGLGTSPRTLQRRLEDEGMRFSDVLDAIHKTLSHK